MLNIIKGTSNTTLTRQKTLEVAFAAVDGMRAGRVRHDPRTGLSIAAIEPQLREGPPARGSIPRTRTLPTPARSDRAPVLRPIQRR